MPDTLPQGATGGTPIATHTTANGTVAIYQPEALRMYLDSMHSNETTASTLPFLNQFKKLPQMTDLMITYFEEFLKCNDSRLRLAPSILIGALSELLVLALIRAAGAFLEDVNALPSYKEKRGDAKITYTTTIVNKVRDRIDQDRGLTPEEDSRFRKFNEVVGHMFESIRLNRNEYAHPEPQTSLSTLPDSDTLLCQASAFNPYARVIMELTDTIASCVPT